MFILLILSRLLRGYECTNGGDFPTWPRIHVEHLGALKLKLKFLRWMNMICAYSRTFISSLQFIQPNGSGYLTHVIIDNILRHQSKPSMDWDFGKTINLGRRATQLSMLNAHC